MTPEKRAFIKSLKARRRRAEYLRSKHLGTYKVKFDKPIFINPKEVETSQGFFDKLNSWKNRLLAKRS